MKRSIKALAVAAPVVTLSGWIILHNPAGSNSSAMDRSMRHQTDGAEAGRLRPLSAGPPIYAPGMIGESVPPAQRFGDMMMEVIPNAAAPQRNAFDDLTASTAGHSLAGKVI